MAKNQDIIKIQFPPNENVSEIAADESSRLLMEELGQIPDVNLKLVNDAPVPEGSRATMAGVCELVVALIGGGALLPTVLTVAHEWLIRQPDQTTIKIKKGDFEVEWSGTSPPDYIETSFAKLVGQEIG